MIRFSPRRAGRLSRCIALALSLQDAVAFAAAGDDASAASFHDVLVTSSPLPGTAIDADRIPGNVRTLSADELTGTATPGLPGALLGRAGSINLNDNQGSEFQPDVLYRGFAASPVLGTPQGLAVYQDGVRINEAFGDAVNWDLIPDVAIRRIDIVSANPLYGLNALGGGIAIQMKDGFSYRGGDAELSGGSFRDRSASLEAGGNDGRLGLYVAARALDRTGWRQHSSDRLRQVYADASLRTGALSADLSYTGADNSLRGQGAVPIQELAQDRSLAFTGPQGDRNRVDFVALHSTYEFDGQLSVQLAAYGRRFGQTVENGNGTGYVACRGTDLTGDSRYTNFNPALGFTYRLAPTLTGYAQLARNTRTPTASEIECSDPQRPCLLPSSLSADPPTLRQVVAQTAEAGLRGHRGGDGGSPRVSWSAGLFRTRVVDDIYGIATSASTGYFRNVGATRRQGAELDLRLAGTRWSGYASYACLDATFESSLLLHSPSNPYADAAGNIAVVPGDRLPGLPRQRFRMGVDYDRDGRWSIGATLLANGAAFYRGDESNQNPPLPGHVVLGVRASYQAAPSMSLYAVIQNVLDARYSTFGLYGDPTGVGAPGVPADGMAGVDPRFQSPGSPRAFFAGLRIRL